MVPDEDRPCSSGCVKALLDEEALKYWSSGSTTYLVLTEVIRRNNDFYAHRWWSMSDPAPGWLWLRFEAVRAKRRCAWLWLRPGESEVDVWRPSKRAPTTLMPPGFLWRRQSCYNLDTFMMGREQVFRSFHVMPRERHLAHRRKPWTLRWIDSEGEHSTAELAKLIKAPVILVVDCDKVTRTMAAMVLGASALIQRWISVVSSSTGWQAAAMQPSCEVLWKIAAISCFLHGTEDSGYPICGEAPWSDPSAGT